MARRQNPKIERTLKRTSSLRQVKQTFLIVCEGEVTEPEYFNSFRLTSANVKALASLLIKNMMLRLSNSRCLQDRPTISVHLCLWMVVCNIPLPQ